MVEKLEIEVTPKMIEAGRRILEGYDRRFDSDDETVIAIFTAMIEEANRSLGS